MLDSIYHLTFKLLINCIFDVKPSKFSLILRNNGGHYISGKYVNQ